MDAVEILCDVEMGVTMEEARCRLCLEIKPLQKSHLLPKSLFRLLRVQNAKNPNPVMFTRKAAWTSSTQFADMLLCFDCEQQFHKNGEDWVLRHCFRGEGRFRLRDMMAGNAPVALNVAGVPFSPSQASLIPTRLVPGMDIDKLAYFAASVIWRAGVHEWVVDEHELKPIDIRDDQLEQLRRYLLGETDFPTDTYLWISISDNESPLTGMVFAPYGGFENAPTPHYSFRFLIPGIMFALFMGCFVPPIVPPLCAVRSPDRVVHLTKNIERTAFEYTMEFMKTSRPSASVREIDRGNVPGEIQ